jgi:acetyl-CoA carboxylase/biotin carboxylase 1
VEKLTSALSGSDLSRALLQAGVGAVSCILQRDEGRSPARHHLAWSEADSHFRELPLLRHVEPLLSDLLELVRMHPTFEGLGKMGRMELLML